MAQSTTVSANRVHWTTANIHVLAPDFLFNRHARYLVRSDRDSTTGHPWSSSLEIVHRNLHIHCRLLTDVCSSAGADVLSSTSERGRRSPSPSDLLIPKNRSTGNLLAHASNGTEKARIRFSFDAGLAAAEYDAMSRLVVDTPRLDQGWWVWL